MHHPPSTQSLDYGWQASVDAIPRPFHRANLFMRVLPIPARGVEIRYTYRTPGLLTGVTVTIITHVILIFMGLSFLSSSRRAHKVET